jgi:hypothetical protein
MRYVTENGIQPTENSGENVGFGTGQMPPEMMGRVDEILSGSPGLRGQGMSWD